MSETGGRAARWLLVVVIFLIVYGSLFPFRFEDAGISSFAGLRAALPWARTTRSDIAANLLLYLPLGACLAWLLAARTGMVVALAGAALAGALLSTTIEVAQIYETRRVASLSDVTYNTLGAAMGAALALVLRGAARSTGRHPLDRVLSQPIAAALVLLWVGYRLVPFAPVLGPAGWLDGIAPLWHQRWVPWDTVRWLVPWLIIGQALTALSRKRSGVRPLLVVMLFVLAGLVVLSGKSLEPAEAIAMLLALALAWALDRLEEPAAAGVLALCLAALLVTDSLRPFDFRLGRDPFSWVPFADSLVRYRSTNLPAMLERCFTYGALVWLLVRSGKTPLAATAFAGVLVLALEILQTWLPGHSADITDPLLVVVAGGLIAVFDSPRRSAAGRSIGRRRGG